MKKVKIKSEDAHWGYGSVRKPISELFVMYGKSKSKEVLTADNGSANPFSYGDYYSACDEAAKQYENSMIGGRKPSSVAAAIIYAVGCEFGLGVKQAFVARHFGVTEVSIRNNLKYLLKEGIVTQWH